MKAKASAAAAAAHKINQVEKGSSGGSSNVTAGVESGNNTPFTSAALAKAVRGVFLAGGHVLSMFLAYKYWLQYWCEEAPKQY